MYTLFRILVCGLTLSMLSCATGDGKKTADSSITSDGGVPINIVNKTWFDIEIYDETRIVPHNNEKTLSLPRLQEGLNGGYSVTYQVKLLDDIYINIRRAENIIIDTNQNAAIIDSPDFTVDSSYFIVKNDSKQTISLVKDKKNSTTVEYVQPVVEINRYTYIPAYHDSPYIKPDNKRLYNLTLQNNDFLIETDQYKTMPFSLNTVAPGFIYEYTFDGKTVFLTDARPLTCIGEPTWSKKLAGASFPVFAEYADRSIKVAIPVNNGVDFIALNAQGEEIKKKKTDNDYGGNAVLSTMLNADENSYLVTGYGTRPSRQFLVKQTSEDGLSWRFSFRTKMGGYKLNTLIPKEGNTYIVAGTVDDSAYMVEIEDGKSEPAWEFLVSDVNKDWKTVQSAAYNAKSNTYIITGIYGGSDPSGKQKAFIGFVEQSGTTGKIKNEIRLKDDKTTDSIIINQVLCDSSGNIYVAGQVLRERKWYAVVQKYNSEGEEQWPLAKELEANSLYTCAVLDEENGQIVLGGAMKTDRSGNMGTPFLQGIDSANGNGLWIEDISPVSKELDCVTGLQKAKNYGYIAALSGINGGIKIFILARLNSRGKILANHKIF
jgi:hypothetical protein